ncbi:peptidylprolyl isomerase [Hyphomonas atlantica corrig.]|uniref:peptidylprolyl isomerase n=1 Tax=Hyphomonas atlantica TaxID=1280948 RepID=UPI00235490C5|nr:peptidylprolyl isomerase [Hyphomonas atlantica]
MKLLRDPLTHFVLAATLIFVAYSVWQNRSDKADSTILVTTGELERLAALYTSEAGALPSEADMAAMVSDLVRDEALSREARRLGLDRDDTIITRRLAQKMSFVVSDLAEDPEPTRDEMLDWHATHTERFTTPATLTFSHIYFSPDVRGDGTETDAADTLAQLNASSATALDNLGDPFMLQRQYGDVPLREVARQFGGEFANELSELSVSDEWQGPLPSAFGLHLVKLESSTPASVIPFDDILDQVRKDWLENSRRIANEQAIQDIIARYTVEIEGVE